MAEETPVQRFKRMSAQLLAVEERKELQACLSAFIQDKVRFLSLSDHSDLGCDGRSHSPAIHSSNQTNLSLQSFPDLRAGLSKLLTTPEKHTLTSAIQALIPPKYHAEFQAMLISMV